jgi:hypothetical protein
LLLHSLRAFPSVIHGRKDVSLEKVVLGTLLLLDTCFPFSTVVLLAYISLFGVRAFAASLVWFGLSILLCVGVGRECNVYKSSFFSMLFVSLISSCSGDFERGLVSGSAFLLSEFTRNMLPSGV